MCLFTKHYLPKKARESIEVIKLVKKTKKPGVYTPYFISGNILSSMILYHTAHPEIVDSLIDFRYTIGKKSRGVGSLSNILGNLIFGKRVGEGFIHSIRFPSDTYFESGEDNSYSPLGYIINSFFISNIDNINGAYLKCIIPKGSWYYTEGFGFSEYASRELIPIKDVTEEIKKEFYERYK